jgi:5-methylcytosine-specific restriction endonuclease McrA
MMNTALSPSLQHVSDADLLVELQRLAGCEREATVHVIAALMEVEARRLHLGEGCGSLFVYCTDVLHFSEHAAYLRIEAARTAQRFPAVLERLAEGSLTLTTIGLLKPHLTADNHGELLEAARHKSKRDVEKMIAALRPLPAVPSTVRKVPAAKPVDVPALGAPVMTMERCQARIEDVPATAPVAPSVPTRPAIVTPLAPERYKVQITISREAHDKLRRAQELLRHAIPSGDPAAIVERALSLLVDDLERKRCAAAKNPRQTAGSPPRSRHVPAAVKREVWARDEGRCAFVGALGRCPERGFLELHHVVPFADGGATDTANLQLRCRAHNAFEADAWFGAVERENRSEVPAD